MLGEKMGHRTVTLVALDVSEGMRGQGEQQ